MNKKFSNYILNLKNILEEDIEKRPFFKQAMPGSVDYDFKDYIARNFLKLKEIGSSYEDVLKLALEALLFTIKRQGFVFPIDAYLEPNGLNEDNIKKLKEFNDWSSF